jgi:diguanylate cyclase (GGDEF)-like protein
VILPGCDELCTASQAERMRSALSSEPMVLNDKSHPVTCSFGATCWKPGTNVNAETLIRLADDALYMAKNQGRDRTVVLPVKPVEVLSPQMAPAGQ